MKKLAILLIAGLLLLPFSAEAKRAQPADPLQSDITDIKTKTDELPTDTNSDITDILADTGELQTDWVDGGRLDLLIDAILLDTGTTLDDYVDEVESLLKNATYGLSALETLVDGVESGLTTIDGFHDVPTKDVTTDVQMRDVVGKKDDTAVTSVGTTKSIIAYLKGLLGFTDILPATAPRDWTDATVTISETVFTAGQDTTTALPIFEDTTSGARTIEFKINLDLATTGFEDVATAGDTVDIALWTKTDDTSYDDTYPDDYATFTAGSLTESCHMVVTMTGVDLKVTAKCSADRGAYTLKYTYVVKPQ